jgi:flagellar protein FliO/FliZ
VIKAPRALSAALAAAPVGILLLPATVFAAGGGKDPYGENQALNLPSETTASHANVGSSSGSLARTFVGLAVVVAVIYGLTWVLRQMKASKEERSHGFGLSTEASVPLGPGRSVHLIRAGRELVLVGSAEQGVVPIRTYSEEEAAALGLLEPRDGDGGDTGRPSARARTLLEKLRERTVR